MKIGLITIHDTVNYGSLLQAFSLYCALDRLGVDVELIDYHNKAISDRESTFPIKECRSVKDVFKHILFHRGLRQMKDNYWDFLQDHVKLSRPYCKSTISESNTQYHTFIIGSDIVWNLNITGGDFTYMLDFAEKSKRKLAFSASVGAKWSPNLEYKIKKYLDAFESISVRESQAAEWIKALTGMAVPVTCDPTMLWENSYWRKFVSSEKVPSDNYVLVYMPSSKTIDDAKAYAKLHKMEVLYLNFYTPVLGVKNVKPIRLEYWLSYIAHAETLFTSSYHGMLFSLYFHTNLFYYNRAYSARMASLSNDLKMGFREATEENIACNIPIDFDYVDMVLEQKRKESWKVLNSYFNR